MRRVHKEDPAVWDGNVIGGYNVDLAESERDERERARQERAVYVGRPKGPKTLESGDDDPVSQTDRQTDRQMGRGVWEAAGGRVRNGLVALKPARAEE